MWFLDINDLFSSFIYILYFIVDNSNNTPYPAKIKNILCIHVKKKWWMINLTLNLLTKPETTHALYLVIIKLNYNYRVKIIILWYNIFLITIGCKKGSKDKAPTGYFLGKLFPKPQSLIAHKLFKLLLGQCKSIGRYLPIIVS